MSSFPGRSLELLILPVATLLIALIAIPALVERGLRRSKRLEKNFRGDLIPVGFGLSILLGALLLLLTLLWMNPQLKPVTLPWFLAVAGFGLLGFIDDTWGDKQNKGLRGHIKAMFRDHRITTGLVKAVGGLALALSIGWMLYSHPAGKTWESLGKVLLAGLLIALSANAINLLDLRPGRATGVFLALSGLILMECLIVTQIQTGVLLLAGVTLPALPAWIRDARAQVMLGDTGSNLLGASLGLALAEMSSLPVQLLALGLLIGLNLLAERVSLTTLIANNRALSALDRLTGVRS